MDGVHDMGGMHGFGAVVEPEARCPTTSVGGAGLRPPPAGRWRARRGPGRPTREEMEPATTSPPRTSSAGCRAPSGPAAQGDDRRRRGRGDDGAPRRRRAGTAGAHGPRPGGRASRGSGRHPDAPATGRALSPARPCACAACGRPATPAARATRAAPWERWSPSRAPRSCPTCRLRRGRAGEPVYAVAFRSDELWGRGEEPPWTVALDLWESYLEEPGPARARPPSPRARTPTRRCARGRSRRCWSRRASSPPTRSTPS